MESYLPNNMPLPRRIVVSNLPVPASLVGKDDIEGAVQVTCGEVSREVLMDGAAGRLRVGTHDALPTSNDGLYVTYGSIHLHLDRLSLTSKPGYREASRQDIIPGPGGNVLPAGVVVQYMEMAPGAIVPMVK